jgi:hypothetical protein
LRVPVTCQHTYCPRIGLPFTASALVAPNKTAPVAEPTTAAPQVSKRRLVAARSFWLIVDPLP